MALALEDRAAKDDIMIGDTPKAVKRRRRLKGAKTRGRLWKHSTLSDIVGLVPPSQIHSSFVFTLVRNPWDRLVSYYHWLRTQNFDHLSVALAGELQFAEFLRHPHTVKSFRNAPYSSYVTLDGKEEDCCFIRLEHFEQDAAPLIEHLGFKLELPLKNKSKRDSDYRTYYDDALAEHLAMMCAEDIAEFDYRFD